MAGYVTKALLLITLFLAVVALLFQEFWPTRGPMAVGWFLTGSVATVAVRRWVGW